MKRIDNCCFTNTGFENIFGQSTMSHETTTIFYAFKQKLSLNKYVTKLLFYFLIQIKGHLVKLSRFVDILAS